MQPIWDTFYQQSGVVPSLVIIDIHTSDIYITFWCYFLTRSQAVVRPLIRGLNQRPGQKRGSNVEQSALLKDSTGNFFFFCWKPAQKFFHSWLKLNPGCLNNSPYIFMHLAGIELRLLEQQFYSSCTTPTCLHLFIYTVNDIQ